MNEVAPDWLAVIVPFLSGAFGVGVTYGMVRTTLKDHADRIIKLEGHLENKISREKFMDYRKECRDDFKEDIQGIKTDISRLNDKFDKYLLQNLAREAQHDK